MEESKTKKNIRRYLPLIVLALLSFTAYYLGLKDYLTFESLKENRERLMSYVEAHHILAPILFMLIYMATVALSLPIGIFLTVLGGFLFPQPYSTIYAIIAATLGATAIFLAAKTAFGDFLREKAGKRLQRIQRGFEKNGWSYLLFLRLVPIFPFWLVNLAPAFLNLKLWLFFWTTLIGIAPGTFVYAQAGSGLGEILETEGPITLGAVFNWKLRIAFIGMGFFVLLPSIIKRYIQKRKDAR